MGKVLFLTRPYHDDTTHYLYYWSSLVIANAQNKNIKVVQLQKEDVIRKKFESILTKIDPVLIFMNGHGNDDSVTGQNQEILVKIGLNERILEGKVVYALSCSSAKNLGSASGAKAYIGYDDVFIFSYDITSLSKPLLDKKAALFLGPSNLIIDQLLKGHTVAEAVKRSKEMFLNNARKVLSWGTSESYLIPFLLWNRQHQIFVGESLAVLE